VRLVARLAADRADVLFVRHLATPIGHGYRARQINEQGWKMEKKRPEVPDHFIAGSELWHSRTTSESAFVETTRSFQSLVEGMLYNPSTKKRNSFASCMYVLLYADTPIRLSHTQNGKKGNLPKPNSLERENAGSHYSSLPVRFRVSLYYVIRVPR
jgi:hypothetical protein